MPKFPSFIYSGMAMRTASQRNKVGLSGTTKQERQREFLKTARKQYRQQLLNQRRRPVLSPADAIELLRVHARVLSDQKLAGELQRLSSSGHDVASATTDEVLSKIPQEAKLRHLLARGRPLDLHADKSRILDLLAELRQKAGTISGIRKLAAAKATGIDPKHSRITEMDDRNKLLAIANASDNQIASALGARGIKIQRGEANPINLSQPVRSLVEKMLLTHRFNTTDEFLSNLKRSLAEREAIIQFSQMNDTELEKHLVNQGVVHAEKRRF